MHPTGSRSQAALVLRVGQSTLRFNPDYELVRLNDLPAKQRECLDALRQDPTFCGVVRSRLATGLSTKSVSREMADLLIALKEPQPLPDRVLADDDALQVITQLVCDGILQIASAQDWLCGPAACRLDNGAPTLQEGAMAGLSLRALKYAAALRTAVTTELCGHLYRYNSLPLTPEWLRRFPDTTAVQDYLQVQSGTRLRWQLDCSWKRASPSPEPRAWMAWSSRKVPVPTDTITFKLYLSPLPVHVREAFRAFLGAITAAGAFHFKIGNDVRGLLRPDKMVAYFGNLDALKDAARHIAGNLSGCPAQGVPFTSELDCGTLLSWGSDPPFEEAVPAWLRRQSWRQWVCNRLSAALAVAKHHSCDSMTALRFALMRLQLENVDLTNWSIGSPNVQTEPVAEVIAV